MNLSMIIDIPAMIVPDQVAVSGDGRDETYAELRDASGRFATLFAQAGIGPGDRVGIFATNRVSTLHAMFGTLLLGAAVVPMNYRARGDEIGHYLRDSGASLIVTEEMYVDSIVAAGMPRERVLTLKEAEEKAAGLESLEDAADVDETSVGILLYTSGTTSLPKGVMLTHDGFTSYVMGQGEAADGTTDGRSLLSAPMYHVAGLSAMTVSLFTGRHLTVIDFEAGRWLKAVEDNGITHAFVVPSMASLLLRHADFAKTDLSSLQMLTYGAAPMPPAVLHEILERFPKTVNFSAAYGQTETNSTVAVLGAEDHRLEGTPEEIELKKTRLASVGKPLDDVEIRIIGEDGQVAAPNVTGEVFLRTGRTMAGYWGKGVEGTRVTLDEERWVHTGDLGHLDEGGYLFLTGRASDLIIRGGENISPSEIDAVLDTHPAVEEAAAFGVLDDQWGERVEAAVRLLPGATVTEEELIALCKTQLSGAKRPDRIYIVDDFPRTATGKVLRRMMAKEYGPKPTTDVAG